MRWPPLVFGFFLILITPNKITSVFIIVLDTQVPYKFPKENKSQKENGLPPNLCPCQPAFPIFHL